MVWLPISDGSIGLLLCFPSSKGSHIVETDRMKNGARVHAEG